MMLNRLIYGLTVVIIFSACSSTKNLSENQNLYTGADIKIKSTAKIGSTKKKDLTSELESLLRPKPNSSILGMRFKLWIYNMAGNPKKKGLGSWLKNKVGEPPVIASASVLEKNREILQNRLENRGYFFDSVTLDTVVKNKKLKATYIANIHAQYVIRNVTFPGDSGRLSKAIARLSRGSLLRPKKPYDLDKIKAERDRIDARLKERGFYYFNPEYLIVHVDSTIGKHQVDMDVHIKPQTPEQAQKVYRIKDVVVYADYDIDSDTSLTANKVTHYQGYTIVDPNKKFQPKIFSRTLVFKPGEVYNRKDHNLSLNRLTTLGVYKFVKARFQPVDTVKGNYLNAYYYLTPTDPKSIRFEVSALTKSNNASGGEFNLSWRHRNLLRGAELFIASAYAGLETQISGTQRVRTTRLGGKLDLYIPRIIAPIRFKTNSAFVPRTKFSLGYEYYDRSNQYTLTSATASAGYQWKENIKKEHQLTVININLVQPRDIDSVYKPYLDNNIVLQRSIEKQFIIGSIYNFNYNSQVVPNFKRHNILFNGNIDLSGNILGLVTGANAKEKEVKKIFGTPFSQYARIEASFTHYLNLRRYRSLNTRILGGVGYGYGNSLSMPYVKAFFAGGVNDIRAFRSRSLGPGSYHQPDTDTMFIEQPGDIKLEMNLEYRAKLFSIVRWAAFVDAGNIWTLRNDSTRPGAKFTKNFLSQVAVGVGLGLRFDVKILILRLDVAFPIRKPYATGESKWAWDRLGIDDAVYNLAIGYPF